MSHLIRTIEQHRVPDMEAADSLEMDARSSNLYEVAKCVKTEKVRKAKGEVVDQWVVVDITKVFNDMKEPVSDVRVEYK